MNRTAAISAEISSFNGARLMGPVRAVQVPVNIGGRIVNPGKAHCDIVE